MDGFAMVRPYLALLQNNTSVPVEAYCVEYAVVESETTPDLQR